MNKKWYQSAVCKGILLTAAHVSLIIAAICMLWLTVTAGVQYLNPAAKVPESYSGTSAFANDLNIQANYIIQNIMATREFETDGELDRDKLVDVIKYLEDGTVSGKNESGVAYKLGELVDWYEKDSWSDGSERRIIVCQKPDGTYRYYRWEDFETQVREGKLNFVENTEDVSYYLSQIQSRYDSYNSGEYYGISDTDGKILYNDCWNFSYDTNRSMLEEYAPDGAEDLLDIVNTNPEWNGKLSELFQKVESAVAAIGSRIEAYEGVKSSWKEGDTNLSYMLIDNENKRVYTNREGFHEYKNADENFEKLKKTEKNTNANFVSMAPSLKQFESEMDAEIRPSDWQSMMQEFQHQYGIKDFKFIISVDTTYPVKDTLYDNSVNYEKIQPFTQTMSILAWIGAAVFLISVIWLTAVAGRSNRKEGVALNTIDKWPAELALLSLGSGVGLFFAWLTDGINSWIRDGYVVHRSNGGYIYQTAFSADVNGGALIFAALVMACACFLCLLGFLSIVRRLKAHTLWKSSFTRTFCRWCVSVWRWFTGIFRAFWSNRAIVTKQIAVLCGFLFLHYLAFAGGPFILFMLLADAAAFIYLVREAIAKQKVKKGIEKIAGGDVEYKIQTEQLKGENKEIAESVNHIGEGLNAAVEQSLKSERLKTDLITNVSHDIKTPLTSIINYVNLLKRENFEDPKIRGYLDVLDAKSQRLKTLTEDVVEASKISSGNIKLELMDLNLVEMIQQTSGEFLEKFEARNLKLVSSLPDHPVLIRADGRRMWRVLANIYNNAAKYAMEGTRVYADMFITDNAVSFSLKNISEQALNINADELTERFIRGDVSRSTEGSGLGLSIAKNLTERQNGEFKLYLDGDLFKVTIIFPRVKTPFAG